MLLDHTLKIGFTGSQKGMTDVQKHQLHSILDEYMESSAGRNKPEFHHGDCIGSDTEASAIAHFVGFIIVTHPPINETKRAFGTYDIETPAKPYLERNHDIVDEVNIVIAAPHEDIEQQRSGTWATIRYTKKMNKALTIIYPDGNVVKHWRQI